MRDARTLALLLVVPLLGCPYEAPFPLSAAPDAPREAKLLGAWRCASASDEKTLVMTLTPLEPRGYTVVMTQAGEKPYTVLAQATTVKGVLSAEESETERPGPRYFFARYSMPNAGVVAWELADDELLKDTPKTPAALQSALEGPKRDEIFQPFCACIRVEETRPRHPERSAVILSELGGAAWHPLARTPARCAGVNPAPLAARG